VKVPMPKRIPKLFGKEKTGKKKRKKPVFKKRATLTLYVEEEVKKELERLAYEEGTSVSALLRAMISECLEDWAGVDKPAADDAFTLAEEAYALGDPDTGRLFERIARRR